MLEILSSMMKEEWRIHASLLGGWMFALFPVLVGAFSFGFSLFIPLFESVITVGGIYTFICMAALLFGLSVGAFALMGREVMNRRFGHASMVAFSARTLPVSEKRILLNVAANDTVFYAILYMLPFFCGFSAAAALTGAVPVFNPLLVASSGLSFLFGLSFSFFLSTLYVRLGKAFLALAAAAFAIFLLSGIALDMRLLSLFPPVGFLLTGSLLPLLWSLLLTAVPFAVSLLFIRIEFPGKERLVRNRLLGLSDRLGGMIPDAHFVAKDMLDLQRSEGGIGKVFFSFLIPLAMIWAMLFVFTGVFALPEGTVFLVFCVLVGALSSTIYNWLTEFDDFSSYAFLPVRVSELMRSKMRGYVILNAFPVAVIVAASAVSGVPGMALFGILAFLPVSAYTVSVTAYLSGLKPNVLIYSAGTFLAYVAAVAPVMVLCIIASIAAPAALLPILAAVLPFSFILAGKAFSRWDRR